ncbi:MAG: putative porin [Syntrophobacteraceae bacterium]
MRVKWCLILGLFILLCFWNTSAFSQAENAEKSGMEILVNLLKAKGVISPDEAASFQKTGPGSAEEVKALVGLLKGKGIISADEAAALNQKLASTASGKKAILVVPRDKEYVQKVTENVVSEIKRDVKAEVKAELEEKSKDKSWLAAVAPEFPDWARRMRLSGDIRLRHESAYYPGSNGLFVRDPNNPTQSLNTQIDTSRERIRARLKLEADVNDEVLAAFRLATGTDRNPVSTNNTFGDFFNKDGFLLDQAYLRFTPVKDLSIWAGRIPNPWLYTDLVWDNDLNFEGVAVKYKQEVFGPVSAFATAGVFPLHDIELSQHDKWLIGAQAGVEYKPTTELTARLGVAYYDYENIQGRQNPLNENIFDFTAPLFMQKGNTLFDISNPLGGNKLALASEFRELDIVGSVDISCWDPIHIIISGDYVKNVAFDRNEAALLSGRNPDDMQDYGYQFGVLVGYPTPRKFLQWNAFLYYKYLGTDAVVDSFTDSDFHLGGTNAKGWILGAELGLMKNVWLTARWLSADEISRFQVSNGPFSVDVFQFDANASF